MRRLSIIIPVYNVETLVRQCLDSVFDSQVPESDYEVIAVNDGSTDGSREVVASFLPLHDNLTLIDQENSGASAARMNGLSRATGEYVWFVDSDDWLAPDALQTVFGLISGRNYDVIAFPMYWHREDPSRNGPDFIIPAPIVTDWRTILRERTIHVWATQRYVSKKSLFDNPYLFFPKGLLHEDEYYGRVLLVSAGNVYICDKPVYHYRRNSGSIMGNISIRSSYDIISNYDLLMRFAGTLPKEDRKILTRHSQRLLISSYNINSKRWSTPEFKTFKRKNWLHILYGFSRSFRGRAIKYYIKIAFFVFAPVMYEKVFHEKP